MTPRTERITVTLPPDIAAYARLCAEMQGQSVSAFIAETIQQRLSAGLAGLNEDPRNTTYAAPARSPHVGRPG